MQLYHRWRIKKRLWPAVVKYGYMSKKLTVASWNIAGGRAMRSLDHFDYEDEDLGYFADELSTADPDIVLLQEVHFNKNRSVARELAGLLGYEYCYEQPMSPSHVDEHYQLGMAVLSRMPLKPLGTVQYPYPHFPLFFSDGRPAVVHHKGAQVFDFGGLMIANTQMLPLTVFGARYDEGEGKVLAQGIEASLLENLKTPVIFGGDFNFDSPKSIYPNLYDQLRFREALPDELTRPNKENIKKTPDHIVYSDGLTLAGSYVKPVRADHYLCVAEFLV